MSMTLEEWRKRLDGVREKILSAPRPVPAPQPTERLKKDRWGAEPTNTNQPAHISHSTGDEYGFYPDNYDSNGRNNCERNMENNNFDNNQSQRVNNGRPGLLGEKPKDNPLQTWTSGLAFQGGIQNNSMNSLSATNNMSMTSNTVSQSIAKWNTSMSGLESQANDLGGMKSTGASLYEPNGHPYQKVGKGILPTPCNYNATGNINYSGVEMKADLLTKVKSLVETHQFESNDFGKKEDLLEIENLRKLINDIKALVSSGDSSQESTVQMQRLMRVIDEKERELRSREAAVLANLSLANLTASKSSSKKKSKQPIDPYMSRIKEGINQYEDEIDMVMASSSAANNWSDNSLQQGMMSEYGSNISNTGGSGCLNDNNSTGSGFNGDVDRMDTSSSNFHSEQNMNKMDKSQTSSSEQSYYDASLMPPPSHGGASRVWRGVSLLGEAPLSSGGGSLLGEAPSNSIRGGSNEERPYQLLAAEDSMSGRSRSTSNNRDSLSTSSGGDDWTRDRSRGERSDPCGDYYNQRDRQKKDNDFKQKATQSRRSRETDDLKNSGYESNKRGTGDKNSWKENGRIEDFDWRVYRAELYQDIDPIYLYCHDCDMKLLTEVSFSNHVRGKKHLTVMKEMMRKFNANCKEMRFEQNKLMTAVRAKRDKNEEKSFCNLCELDVYGPMADHRSQSAYHRALKHYIHPYCKYCTMEFPQRVDWETHRYGPEHIRMIAKQKMSDKIILWNDKVFEDTLKDLKITNKANEAAAKKKLMEKEEKAKANEKREKDKKDKINTREDDDIVEITVIKEKQEAEKTEKTKNTTENMKASAKINNKEVEEAEQNSKDEAKKNELENLAVGNLTTYDENMAVGKEFLRPVTGFFCRLCKKLLPTMAESAAHLKSKPHWDQCVKSKITSTSAAPKTTAANAKSSPVKRAAEVMSMTPAAKAAKILKE